MTTTEILVKRADFKRKTLTDESPDLSFYGEYSNCEESEDAIDRKERGDMRRGEFRYFNPTLTGEETGNPESPEQDYKRMEAYNTGGWCMIGIRATVTLEIPANGGSIMQTIESPGLWGIESDSDESYLDSVFADECSVLAEMVEALGNVRLVED